MPDLQLNMTKLEAVNTMLSCVGEAPINTLIGELPAGIQIAVDLLNKTSRAVQTDGWHFNTEEDVELSRDSNSKVPTPGNAMQVDLTVEDGRVDIVQRGDFLYDKKNHTYTFTFNPKCTIVYYLAWEELPSAAREYICIKAARVYQDQTVGSDAHHQFTQNDEMTAFVTLQSTNNQNQDATIFDNWCVASIVARQRPRLSQFQG